MMPARFGAAPCASSASTGNHDAVRVMRRWVQVRRADMACSTTSSLAGMGGNRALEARMHNRQAICIPRASCAAVPIMFWKKKTGSNQPPVTAPGASPSRPTDQAARPAPDELERVVEALASIVRAIGRFALDLPESSARQAEQLAEHWSQHLLIRRPKPGDEARTGTPSRDYRALAAFVTQQRSTEHTYAGKVLKELRQTVWAFVQSLNGAFEDETKRDSEVTGRLLELKLAAEGGSLEQLRNAALSAASSIAEILEQRRFRRGERNAALGHRLAALGPQLEAVRRGDALDGVTQFSNRKAFDEYAERCVELNKFCPQTLTLLRIDLDGLEGVGERHGQDQADEVLRDVARSLVHNVGRNDALMARYSAHGFAIVMPETALAAATAQAERLRASVRKLDFPGCPGLVLTASIGISVLQPFEGIASWVERADRTLRDAKRDAPKRPARTPA
jgi:diguanylate cyclase (GGDEF)-like protein